jgi:hypothetical protein
MTEALFHKKKGRRESEMDGGENMCFVLTTQQQQTPTTFGKEKEFVQKE